MPHVLLSHRHAGALLRHFRANRGLTQTQVARQLWSDYKTVLRRERGQSNMLMSDLIAHAAVFDYDVVLQKKRRPGARPTGTGWPA